MDDKAKLEYLKYLLKMIKGKSVFRPIPNMPKKTEDYDEFGRKADVFVDMFK